MQCPKCDGTGKGGPLHINKGPNQKGICEGHWFRESLCPFCTGSGEVPDHVAGWIADGKALRNERISRNELSINAARKLGISLTEFSAAETGRIDPSSILDRYKKCDMKVCPVCRGYNLERQWCEHCNKTGFVKDYSRYP